MLTAQWLLFLTITSQKNQVSVWGLCQELKQKHSHTHTYTPLQTYISLSFVFWNQVKCLFVYFLISISKWLQHTACFGKLCQCVLEAFFNDNITNNNQWKPHGCWTACEMLKVHMFCVPAQMPAVGSRVCKRAHMWAIVSARGWLMALTDQVQLIHGMYLSITAELVWILRSVLVTFHNSLCFWFLWWGTRSEFKVIWIKTKPCVLAILVYCGVETPTYSLAKITNNSPTLPPLSTVQPVLADEALA